MTAQYLIFLPDGTTDGPYTEEDLLDMVDADELGAGTVCEDLETRRRCRVLDLFKVIPPPAQEDEEPDRESDDEAKAEPARAPAPTPNRWIPAPVPQLRPAVAAVEAPAPVRLLHHGHPSLLMYWRSLIFAISLMAGGWYAGRWEQGGIWLAAGWLSGGLWLALTLLRRASIEYRVTTRRVELEHGMISKSSQEIRIPDIRAIHVRKSGLTGLLGIGDLVFSAASGEGEDIVFRQTPGAHRLKLRVRRLQDKEA